MLMKITPYPLVNEEKKFLVFWTPRCGCTTICHWFFRTIGREDALMNTPPSDVGAKVHWYRDREFFHGRTVISKVMFRYLYMLPRLRRLYKDPSYYKFTVIRNPYARIVSSYLGMASNTNPAAGLGIFARAGDKVSFLEFLHILEENRSIRMNPHFRPQTDNDCWQSGVHLDSVIKLEELSDGIADINSRFGLSVPIERLYTTKRGAPQVLESNFSEMSYYELASSCRANDGKIAYPGYEHFFTGATRELVSRIYARDIAEFDYRAPELRGEIP